LLGEDICWWNWENTLGVAKGKNGNRKRLAENGANFE